MPILSWIKGRGRQTPKHFFLQLEPSADLMGHTTSFSGSKIWAEMALGLGGMALVEWDVAQEKCGSCRA